MTTLRDIAGACGVSIRTVSRALNGSGYVSAPVRERVLAVAGRLGYRPDRAARSLRTRRSYEVLVLAWNVDELHMAKVAAMEQELRRAGYAVNLLFGRAGSRGERERTLQEIVQQRPAAAALFVGGGVKPGAAARRLQAAGIACVIFDAPVAKVDSVCIDRGRGVRDAVRYLAARGHSRIGYLGWPTDSNRLQGYHAALDELGLSPLLVDLGGGAGSRELARRAGRRFMRRRRRPSALQVFSDEVALCFMAGLRDAGARIPEDVAVVGFDDRHAAMLASPPLTTVAQPNAEVGRIAAGILLAKIAGDPAPAGGWSRTLPARLVVRESA